MEKMLVISQNEMDTWFVNGISVGRRDPRNIWGDKIKEVLKEKNIDEDMFISEFGKSYEDHIKRVLNNEEFPKKQVVDKILKFLDKEVTFFHDKQLKNVLVNDSRLVIAEYETDARAMEVKKLTDEVIVDCVLHEKPIVIRLPKE